jgi:hypothetical protein
MKPHKASIENKHRSRGHHQNYQNYEQPCQTYQNSDFQSNFLVLVKSFQNKFSMKNIGPTCIDMLMFKIVLYFLKTYPIVVGSVNNFGIHDIVLDTYVVSCPTRTKNIERYLSWVLNEVLGYMLMMFNAPTTNEIQSQFLVWQLCSSVAFIFS